MSAKPKVTDPYADERTPFISKALFDDLNSDSPTPEAVAWVRRKHDEAMADPSPPLTSDEMWARLMARHEARLKRGPA